MTREERIANLKILKSRITVFDEDDNKQVKALQETIKELEQGPKTGYNGCDDCKYETYPDFYYPCCDCKNNYVDKWQMKEGD